MNQADASRSIGVPEIRSSGLIIGGLAFLLMGAGFVWRRPDQWVAPQFWFEDGAVFFYDAATLGWGSLLKPHAGYLHLVPRVTACLTKGLDWEYLPIIYMMVAVIGAAWVGARVACARLPVMERILAALALVAVPHGGEVFLNITNLQWILNVLLVINLRETPPENRREALRRGIEIVVAGLSSPMAILLFPFAVLWCWHWRKARPAFFLMSVWIVCMLIQLVFLGSSDRVIGQNAAPLLDDFRWVMPQYCAALFIGNWHFYFLGLGWGCVAVGCFLLMVLFLDRSNPQRVISFLLLMAGVGLLIAGRVRGEYWPNPLGAGARYTYLPFVLIMWSFASLAVGTKQQTRRLLALALFAMIVWSAVSNWTVVPLPRYQWPLQVREARAGARTEFEIAPGIRFPVPHKTEP